MRLAAATAALLTLAGCATTPPRPDPSIDLVGEWRIVAVDGEATPADERFTFTVKPPNGSAQFGCNAGGGPLAIANGWVTPGDPWISTVAGCPSPHEWLRFDRRGNRILASPLAVERSARGVRLRNAIGSIDLVRAPPITPARIAGTWSVDAINGIATRGGPSFRVTITERIFDGMLGCNNYNAEYRIEGSHYVANKARTTERGCEMVDPVTGRPLHGVPVLELEAQALAILRGRPEIRLRFGERMALVSSAGSIEFSRAD